MERTVKYFRQQIEPFKEHVISSFWYSVNHFASILGTLLTAYIFANFLSKNDYGIYKYIMSIVAMLSIFAMPGLNQIYGKDVVEHKEGKINHVVKIKALSSLIGSVVCVALSLYYIFHHNNIIGYSFVISAIFLPFIDPLAAADFYFLGKNKQKTLASINSIASIVSIVMVFVVILKTKNIILISLIYFVTSLLPSILSYYFSTKEMRQNKITAIKLDKVEINRSIKVTVSNIIPTIAQYIDKIIVFQILGSADLAIYNIAVALPDQIKSYLKNTQNIFFKKTVESMHEDFFNKYIKKLLLPIIFLILVIILYALIAPLVFKILFPLYQESIFYSILYSISILAVLSVIPSNLFTIKHNTATLHKFNLLRSIFQIAIMFVFTYFWGLIGLIISRVISEIFTLGLSIFLLKDGQRKELVLTK